LNIVNWTGILESLLFAAGDEGLTLQQIMKVMDVEEWEALQIIDDLKREYEESENRGIILIQLAGTYQLATKKEHAIYLKRLVETPAQSTLSQAALETLTIIAYKQPITRLEIEEIRGVKADHVLQTLVAKGLVQEVGRADGPGRPILYGTTKEFLDYFGLKGLEELPPLPDEKNAYEQEEADLFFDQLNPLIE